MFVLFGFKLKENKYYSNFGCESKQIDEKDYTDIICVFKEKNEYMLYIYANDGSSNSYPRVATFYFEYNK